VQVKFFIYGVLAVFLLSGLAEDSARAQSIQLSAEQERMLNQLPPAQRQQALAALRQAQERAAGQSSLSTLSEQTDSPRPASPAVEEEPEVSVVAGSTLVISFMPRDDLSEEQRAGIEESPALVRLEGTQVFQVDGSGYLEVPGVTSVPVTGLTEAEVQLRLGAEPALRSFDLEVDLLEATQSGSAGLEPFGYDVFETDNASFDPILTGPVPPDYILGPGDTIRAQLYGNVTGVYEYEVSRDGILNLPELGPIPVAGLQFTDFRADIERRVQEMLIGTEISVTLGRLRTIRVFVFGDANQPGSYVVSSLATVSTAIYAAGGISEIGSLRDVQVKRRGQVVARMDLYDLLLNGDSTDDVRLRPGDVIFVPPVGSQVSIAGAVKRPAVYEADSETSIADLVALAGGFSADAFPGASRVERISADAGRVVVSVDAASEGAGEMRARDGDLVFIPEVLPEFQRTIELLGHVYRPGPMEWRPAMRLTDVIRSIAELKPGADTDYVLLRRENSPDRTISVMSADFGEALANPGSESDPEILPRDKVYVFALEYGRQRYIQPLLRELELQARYGEPNPVVSVSGQVLAPGIYPMEPGMRVSDLVRAAGALSEEAYAIEAELVRYEVVDNEYRSTEVVDIDLAAALGGSSADDLLLTEHDSLNISRLPEWDSQWTVELRGEVKFPGQYRIRKDETLAQILVRAGGLTDAAFPEGAVFLRETLREQEQQQLEGLAARLESDLAAQSLEAVDTTGSETLETGRALLNQLRNTRAVGRLVIDIDSTTAAGAVASELVLRDGDQLLVPRQAQAVTVIGETQQNTSHLYEPGLSRDDYIAKSGGLTRRADRKLIYIVRANGAVHAGQRSRWFGRRGSAATDIRPGDTIVVPMEVDRIRPLTFWTQVTQILYQAAIAVAAVETFNR